MSWHTRIATVAREKGKSRSEAQLLPSPYPTKASGSISTIQAPHILACMVPIA